MLIRLARNAEPGSRKRCARADQLPIGIATSSGNTNHIAAGIVAKAAGADVKKLKVVVFGSGGESMTALLGGHVGLVVTPSANLIPHLQSGKLRAIAVSARDRAHRRRRALHEEPGARCLLRFAGRGVPLGADGARAREVEPRP